MKKIKNAILVGTFVILFILPIVYVLGISLKEQQKFSISTQFNYEERSFGEPILLEKKEFTPQVNISGVISTYNTYLVDGINLENCFINVTVGDTVKIGDSLWKCGSKIKSSPYTGKVLKAYPQYSEGIVMSSFDDLSFLAKVDLDTYSNLQKNFTNEDLELSYINTDKNVDEDQKVSINYSVSGGDLFIGQELDLYFTLESIIGDFVVAPKNAVYKMEDGKTRIRIVSPDGDYLGESEVNIIAENSTDYAIAYDLSIGNYVDLEYGRFMNKQVKNND